MSKKRYSNPTNLENLVYFVMDDMGDLLAKKKIKVEGKKGKKKALPVKELKSLLDESKNTIFKEVKESVLNRYIALTEGKLPSLQEGKSILAQVSKHAFLRAVSLLTNAIKKGYHKPILDGILIESESGYLNLTIFYGKMFFRIELDAIVQGVGISVIDSKSLLKLADSFPKRKKDTLVTLNIPHGEKGETAYITQDDITKTVYTMDYKEFIDKPDVWGSLARVVTFPYYLMKDVLEYELPIAKTGEAGRNLDSILIEFEEETINFVATDGHRLAYIEYPRNVSVGLVHGEKIVVNKNVLIPLFECFKKFNISSLDIHTYEEPHQQYVVFSLNGGKIRFLFEREWDSLYPNYRSIMPEILGTKILVNRKKLLQAIDVLVGQEALGYIAIEFDYSMVMSIYSWSSGYKEVEEVRLEEPADFEMTYFMNGKYLKESLKELSSLNVELYVTSREEPMVVKREVDYGIYVDDKKMMLVMPKYGEADFDEKRREAELERKAIQEITEGVKVNVSKIDLLKAFETLKNVTGVKAIRPILLYALVNTKQLKYYQDGITLQATDFETSIKIEVDADRIVDGEATVSIVDTVKALKSLPKSSSDWIGFTIPVDKEKYALLGTGGTIKNIPVLDPEDYPDMSNLWDSPKLTSAHIDADKFKEILTFVSPSMAKDQKKYYLSGMCIDPTPTGINFVSTDGERLSLYKLRGSFLSHPAYEKLKEFIVQRTAVNLLRNVLSRYKKTKDVTISLFDGFVEEKNNHCLFSFDYGKIDIVTLPNGGNFPEYKEHFDGEDDEFFVKIQVNKKDVIKYGDALVGKEKEKKVKMKIIIDQGGFDEKIVMSRFGVEEEVTVPILSSVNSYDEDNLYRYREYDEEHKDMDSTRRIIDTGVDYKYLKESFLSFGVDDLWIMFKSPDHFFRIQESLYNSLVNKFIVLMPVRVK